MKCITVGVLAPAILLAGTDIASAGWLFGYSSSEGAQQLVINGTFIFDTSDSPFPLSGPDTQGWWSSGVANFPGNTNYVAGVAQADTDFRNFFTFDLSSLDVPATSAYLSLPRFQTSPPFPIEYTLWDVTTPAEILNFLAHVNLGIYDDLGTGIAYGSVLVDDFTPDPLIVTLNASALEAINSTDKYFSVGGSVPGFVAPTPEPPPPVPEPTTVLLLGTGLAVTGVRRRLGKKRTHREEHCAVWRTTGHDAGAPPWG